MFAFVAASVNAIKAGIRGVKNAKLAFKQATESGKPQSTVGNASSENETAVIGKMKDLNNYKLKPREYKVADLLPDLGIQKRTGRKILVFYEKL